MNIKKLDLDVSVTNPEKERPNKKIIVLHIITGLLLSLVSIGSNEKQKHVKQNRGTNIGLFVGTLK